MNQVCEARAKYGDTTLLEIAASILLERVKSGPLLDSPGVVKDYLRNKIGHLEYEVFAVLFVDAQHHLISFQEMFRGTLSQTSVYPREIVKTALELNAAAVVLAHNHPSNITKPSRADETLTSTLKSALALIDVRVLDHIIVGPTMSTSMAECGLV